MGKAVKKVTGVLTGHSSGGGKSESNEKATSNTASQSWLEQNPQYQALQNNALAEAANFNMPQYQLAGVNDNLKQALEGLSKGTDTTEYKQAAQYLKDAGISQYDQGQSQLQTGQSYLSGATDILKQYQNMSQSDYQKMVASEYNNDLVKSQIADATLDINEQRDASIQGLNQRATSAGAMGSSRAGVAQGVITGKALRAVGAASVQYRTAEESAATQRLQNYLSLRTSAASQMANIGSQQQQFGLQQSQLGLNQYNTGMQYTNQANQIQVQNYQNQMAAGNLQRSFDQQALDVQRQNQMMAQSPALARLSYYNQVYLPMANLSTTGNTSGTSTTTSNNANTGGNMLGGLMGMGGSALGSYFGGSMGGQAGGIFGGAIGNSFGR